MHIFPKCYPNQCTIISPDIAKRYILANQCPGLMPQYLEVRAVQCESCKKKIDKESIADHGLVCWRAKHNVHYGLPVIRDEITGAPKNCFGIDTTHAVINIILLLGHTVRNRYNSTKFAHG